ncbi:helix-turn-helix transcriptional regulator [Bradyrhizobium sp. sBnM-33]|uniref:helix-turn-helix transcriptional regulator n=1 Tax=Bradyrhizobium sp. sBnM-33 TaxID=2831780 RepID=UPI001BCC29E3|nr:helix-turn-helix transcriptional regulator [Bradyrhizobium sp. sBnM-33]WOH47319.1 helix-turn-helix transcriptional regulator [Bradyrhizobium sp. sBnM-33]
MINYGSQDRLLTAVDAIYEAATDPSKWPAALGAIADCFGDVGAVLVWRRDDGSFGTIVSDTLIDAQRDYEESGWANRDIRATRATERGYFFNGVPITDRHLCSPDEIRNDPCYTQFLAKQGLGWVAGIAVSPEPHVGVLVSVQRDSSRKSEFSDDELGLLVIIGRHIEKSLRLSIRLLDAELTRLGLGEALARIGIGVFSLDSLGRVVFSNPAGRRLIGDELHLVQDRLRIGSGSTREAIDEAITHTLRGYRHDLVAEPKPLLVHSLNSNRRLVIYLLPIGTRTSLAEEFLTNTRAIVLVIEQKLDEPPDPTLVRDVLGLTLGEARIAALVGSGLPPREAAERLGIAEDTARNLLKRVFSKVGVSRQSELVGLLAKLVLR